MSLRQSLLGQALLRPLTPLYALGLATHQLLLHSGRIRTESLPGLVFSVGSLSAGGAGKTPFTLALSQALHRLGYPVAILSRGYGRRSRQTLPVDPSGSAADFGDEPLLLARRAGVPVYVGRSRHQAGLLAAANHRTGPPELPPPGPRPPNAASLSSRPTPPLVFLLDDGFQHRRLVRDLDLILLTAKDAVDRLLPAGNLREPLSALRRADVLVLREEEAPALEPLLQAFPSHRDARPPIIRLRRSLRLPPETAQAPRPTRPLLFSGIARPQDLGPMLLSAGLPPPVHHVVFSDHHRYQPVDITRLRREATRHAADGFVTTEKDAVKLTPAMRQQLASVGPLLVPELSVSLVDERAALADLFALVPRLDRRGHTR